MILTILTREPMHGFGISQRLTVLSQDQFRVDPGSLFPCLYRLEQDGKLKAEWRVTENLRPVPYPDADRLVMVWDDMSKSEGDSTFVFNPCRMDRVASSQHRIHRSRVQPAGRGSSVADSGGNSPRLAYSASLRGRIQMFRNRTGLPWSWRPI